LTFYVGDDMRISNYNNERSVIVELGNRIQQYRISLNITQAELAFRSKYTHEYIRRVEAKKSKKYFSIDAICNIADALNISVSYLFEKKEDEED